MRGAGRRVLQTELLRHAGSARIASARAGNVIGGGDWAEDRIVPDAMRAFTQGTPLKIRYPAAVRPWQHVLDPVVAYLLLAERLWAGEAAGRRRIRADAFGRRFSWRRCRYPRSDVGSGRALGEGRRRASA